MTCRAASGTIGDPHFTGAEPMADHAPAFDEFQATPAKPLLTCDLIMKGGITSGVVYPAAVIELAKRYSFRGIGGASAGAIAAAGAAAAELGRDSTLPGAGFPGLHSLQAELTEPGKLLDMFEPDGGTHVFFEHFKKVLGGVEEDRTGGADKPPEQQTGLFDRIRGAVNKFIDGIARKATRFVQFLGMLAVVLIGCGAFALAAQEPRLAIYGAMGIGVVLLIVATILAWIIGRLLRKYQDYETKYGHAYGAFKANRYGISTGFSTAGKVRLINFLHAKLNALAGLAPNAVLTFKMLEKRSVKLRLMSSNLSLQCPHVFPLSEGTQFLFKRAEFDRLFPKEVVEAMIAHDINSKGKRPFPIADVDADSLFFLPPSSDLPVIVAVRCSLAHPGLFSAVPVFALTQKYVAKCSELQKNSLDLPPIESTPDDIREVWLSDGGIVSNFPIHLFDRWFPDAPTFGINLADSLQRIDVSDVRTKQPTQVVDESYLVCPRGIVSNRGKPNLNRVHLPRAGEAASSEWRDIPTILKLVEAVFYTAKNHQMNAQTELPGFRERIVTVRLDENEGGLNVTMPPTLVKTLQDYGREAGEKLVYGFAPSPAAAVLPGFATAVNHPGDQFEHHRWVRLRIVLTHLERELCAMRDVAANTTTLAHIRHLLTQAQTQGGPDGYPYMWDEKKELPKNALAVFDALLALVQAHFPSGGRVFDQHPPVITPQAIKRLVPIDGYDA